MTRKDYLEGRVTYRQYYASIVAAAGIKFAPNDQLVLAAKRNPDQEHYNGHTTPLLEWYMAASAARSGLVGAFKAHNDFYTDAGAVCTIKEAVRQAIEGGV